MKKKWFFYNSFYTVRRFLFVCLFFVSFLHLCKGESLFNYLEYKWSSVFTLPAWVSEKEKAVSASTGLKLSFRDVELRGYVTLPKTEFSDISSAEGISGKIELLNDFRYGAGLSLFKKTFPVTLKAGHNIYSKSVSKIRNPSPSTAANPLTKTFAFSTGNGASLPVLSSSVQPLSFSVNFSIPENLLAVPVSGDFFITEDHDSAASIAGKFEFSRFVYVQQSFCAGRFFIENQSSALKKNYADFSGDFFYSFLSETAFQSPVLKLHLYCGFQESPYESDSVWLKMEGRSVFKIFLVDFSYFFIPTSRYSPKAAPLIGASSSVCRIVEQASVNPQLVFLFDDKNSSLLRAGVCALENWKVTSTNVPVQLNTLKIRGALAFESRFFNLRFDFTDADRLLSGEPPVKSSRPDNYQCYSLSSLFSGENCKSSFSFFFYRYPPFYDSDVLKETFSSDVNLAFSKLNLSFKGGGEAVFKDREIYSASVNMGLNYAVKTSFFRSSLMVSFEMPVL